MNREQIYTMDKDYTVSHRYICYLENIDPMIFEATDAEEAAWLALAYAKKENTKLKDVQLIEE